MNTSPNQEDFVRLRRRQQRSIDTRERILEAAAEEFAEMGFAGASTRRVSERASIQHSLVTYHFKSKDGLWRAVMSSLNDRFTQIYRSRLEGLRGVDAATKLRLFFEDFIRFSAVNPNYHWLMAYEASTGGRRLDWLADRYVKPFFKVLIGLIRDAQKAGGFIKGDPQHLVTLFFGAATHAFMISAAVKKATGRDPNSLGYLEEHVKLCVRMFIPESRATSSDMPEGATRALSTSRREARGGPGR